MAKAKHTLGSKNFFTMTVLSVTAFMLIVFTFALQKPTNTQSNAAEGCVTIPTLTAKGTYPGTSQVTYHYLVANPNSTDCKRAIRYELIVNKPSSGWDVTFRTDDEENFGDTASGTLTSGLSNKSDLVRIRVWPDPKATKGVPYTFKVKACEAFLVDGELMRTEYSKCGPTKSFVYTKS